MSDTSSEKPLIVWDLDEVLANMSAIMCERLNPLYGTATHPSAWTNHEFHQFFGGADRQTFIRRMIDLRIMEDCTPEHGSREVLSDLNAAGWRQVIVTARGWHPDADAVTRDWLRRHGMAPFIDEIVIVDAWASKVDALRRLGRAALYVEDNPQHALAAAERDLAAAVLLLDRPWNRTVTAKAPLVRIEAVHAALQFAGRAMASSESTATRVGSRAAADALPWEPIARAPRDGTLIDLWRIDAGATASRHGVRFADCFWAPADRARPGQEKAGWYTNDGGGLEYLGDDSLFSHYLLLTPPDGIARIGSCRQVLGLPVTRSGTDEVATARAWNEHHARTSHALAAIPHGSDGIPTAVMLTVTVAANVLVGALLFGERLGLQQGIGIALAGIAVLLPTVTVRV